MEAIGALMGILLGIGIGGVLPCYLFWYFLMGGRGKALHKKFQAAGNLKGKKKAEIIAFAGNPSSYANQADGKQLVAFNTDGYGITLIFEGEICQGVAGERY